MEGLIKGLLDVALGGGGGNADAEGGRRRNHHDDDDEQEQERSHDERSRSSWAQVVATGDDDSFAHEHQLRKNQQHYQSNTAGPGHWGTTQISNAEEGESAGGTTSDDGDWQTVGQSRHKKQHDRRKKVPMDTWHGYKQNPGEQQYNDEVNLGADIEPSHEELSDLAKACNNLWELDTNRLMPGKDYEIDCGEGKKAYQKQDMASGTLFSWLSDDVFRRPTFARFCSLLDNYNPNQGCKEVVTSEEKHEQAAFIEEISRTAPIKYLHKYLVAKGVVSDSYEQFKKMMTGLWFDLYGRGGSSGSSSAFEHIFVGEVKDTGECEVSGFHNWIQFYLEEVKGRIDYQGYIFPRRRGQIPDSETQLLTIQFEWNGVLKSLSSTLVGVSPEFEVALYTLCFYLGGEDNHVYLGPYPVNIKCYRLGNNNKIGSIFPIAEC